MMMFKLISFILALLPAIISSFHTSSYSLSKNNRLSVSSLSSVRTIQQQTKNVILKPTISSLRTSDRHLDGRRTLITTTSLGVSSSSFSLRSSLAESNSSMDENHNRQRKHGLTIRDKLRQITGFSFTVFRKTLRGITGISLTAIYASTVAATGLWIRKTTSIILSLFPSWFRYFLQPILVMYYVPLFILRSITGPTRRNAKSKHEHVLEAWKEAVEYAEQTERDGYWPVTIGDDGCFEMVAPPDPQDTKTQAKQKMSNAMFETVEHAKEIEYNSEKQSKSSSEMD